MLLWKNLKIFSRNLSCQSSHFWWKLIGLFLSMVSWVEWKICKDRSRLTFSSYSFTSQFHALACSPRCACLQVSFMNHWFSPGVLKNTIHMMLMFMLQLHSAVASWLVRLTPERAVWVRALARDIVLGSWARHFTLTVPLSTQEYKWVPTNSKGNFKINAGA